jgi:hypothetical protein
MYLWFSKSNSIAQREGVVMSINPVQTTPYAALPIAQGGQVTPSNAAGSNSFAATFAAIGQSSNYTDEQLKNAFASTSTPESFAKQAASMGLNEDQVQHAMQICGYGSSDPNTCKANIESWVANTGNGYAWDANGALTAAPSTTERVINSAAQPAGGMTIAGHFISTQQIKDFYAKGGNANEVLQQNGITNPWEIGGINAQARQVAGVTMTAEENQQSYFKQYQKYNPNGKYANDFAGFVNDQNPFTKMNMQIGQYTGAVTALGDFEPGGIYNGISHTHAQNGLGPRGMGDVGGWWKA